MHDHVNDGPAKETRTNLGGLRYNTLSQTVAFEETPQVSESPLPPLSPSTSHKNEINPTTAANMKSFKSGTTVPVSLSSYSYSSISSSDSDSTQLMTIPGSMGFMSAHTLINMERVRQGRAALRRSVALDEMCRVHAQRMADQTELFHCADSMEHLKLLLDSDSAGENIQRGPSVKDMHLEAMRSAQTSCKNILAARYLEFGVGTAMGKDGRLYMTQLFRGPRTRKEESQGSPEYEGARVR